MAENKENKSKRAMMLERLQKRYPDRQFDDEEVMFGQISDDYDESESQLGQYREREGKLQDLFSRDPKSAQFITDMAKGKDPFIGVIERIGIDGVTDLINNPEKKEEYAAANTAYIERIAQEKSYEDEYNKNLAESVSTIEQTQNEMGLSDEEMDSAMELIMKITNEAIMGKFTRDTLGMAVKAMKHDADVENATTEGEIAGRNAKIEERLRKPTGGDGMPVMGGSNNTAAPRNIKRNVFDIAADAR